MTQSLEKAKKIRLLALDVDGVLTTGALSYSKDDDEKKIFHAHDGLGLKLLIKAGITIALISGRKSNVVMNRAAELGITHLYLGHDDKVPAYEDLKSKLNLEDDAIAYMGDDLPDLPLLRRAGLAFSVPDAPNCVKNCADIVSVKKGGQGAVREICEYILQAQNKLDPIIASFMTR